MPKRITVVNEETYRLLVELKQRAGCKMMDEAIGQLIELSRMAVVMEALEYLRNKRLREGELEELTKLKEELRKEELWLRRS